MSDPQRTSLRFRCPGCGQDLDVAPDLVGQRVVCPYCNTDFFASPEQSHLPVVDDTSPQPTEADRESALDKLRIENFTALRMGAIRARSWWLIAMCMSVLIALDMVGRTVIFLWVLHQWPIGMAVVGPMIRLLVAGLMAWFAWYAAGRAAEFEREIERPAQPDPTTPPDFSTLSDGSDHWKNLENIR